MTLERDLLSEFFFRLGFLLVLFITVTSCEDDSMTISIPTEPTVVNPLPLFSIQTNGATIVDEPKIAAEFTITKGEEILYSGNMGIEIRGSSSQLFPKKSFGIETWDADGNDIDVSLMDMPEEEDWILYAPYSDKTLMRNILIYDLARDMGMYASRAKFVEVNINFQNQGLYVFMEKLKRDKARIDINKLKEDENDGEDLTGGYIIKIDKNDPEGYTDVNSFNSTFGSELNGLGGDIRFLYEYPAVDDITGQQKDYISTYITDFEEALAGSDFMDPEQGYESYIDVNSFIDFFLLNEISNNVDGYRISTYMSKDKNDKLKMGPIWDFNLAFGNANYCSGGSSDVWAYQFNDRCPDDFWSVPFWWKRFLEDPVFVERLQERWTELRAGELSNVAILGKVDSYLTILDEANAVQPNFLKWQILGTYVWPNEFVGQSYLEEISYLKEWITDRTLWLDKEIEAL